MILLSVLTLVALALLADQFRSSAPTATSVRSDRQTIASTQPREAVKSEPIEVIPSAVMAVDTLKRDSAVVAAARVDTVKVVEAAIATETAPATPVLPLVTLYNGCGVKGIGSKAKAALEEMGFTVVEVRNARNYDYKTSEIRDPSESRIGGILLADSLGIKQRAVTWDSTRSDGKTDVSLIVGKDYRKLRWKI